MGASRQIPNHPLHLSLSLRLDVAAGVLGSHRPIPGGQPGLARWLIPCCLSSKGMGGSSPQGRGEAVHSPAHEPCRGGGTLQPSAQQHSQETARHSPKSQQAPRHNGPCGTYAPQAQHGGEVQGLHPRGLQSTRNILALAMTRRVGSRQDEEGCPWL